MTPDWNDGQPIYRQIRARVLGLIVDGSLAEGAPLPSVRAVAAEGRVNHLTVLKAYQQLADEGIVESRRGLGMFVLQGAQAAVLAAERERFLREEWPQVAARMQRLGIDAASLLRPTDEPGENTSKED